MGDTPLRLKVEAQAKAAASRIVGSACQAEEPAKEQVGAERWTAADERIATNLVEDALRQVTYALLHGAQLTEEAKLGIAGIVSCAKEKVGFPFISELLPSPILHQAQKRERRAAADIVVAKTWIEDRKRRVAAAGVAQGEWIEEVTRQVAADEIAEKERIEQARRIHADLETYAEQVIKRVEFRQAELENFAEVEVNTLIAFVQDFKSAVISGNLDSWVQSAGIY
ncbi:MAG: hypothetical protein M1840_001274 [Geoglossum simile]|nr:MAG: hypothetical protein M1840_001274 [Geoglossum simile]